MDETQKEKLEWLKRELQKGLDDLEAGRYQDGETAMAEIREKLLKLKAKRDKTSRIG
jgi:predicted transcriptional regulator